MTFIRTKFVSHELKKGFDEVKPFEMGQKPLSSVEAMMVYLKVFFKYKFFLGVNPIQT